MLASFTIGTSTDAATSSRRLLPGLTLEASPARLREGEPTEVRFTVSDAGDAVGGAKVDVGGRAGTTDGRGRVTLALTSSSAVTARATRDGYTAATTRLGARRRAVAAAQLSASARTGAGTAGRR